jgi:2-haloacid dehalogenase
VTANRRWFLHASAAVAALASLRAAGAAPVSRREIRAVAFDAFALFDPRPIFQACERVVPGRGSELAAAWRSRQFEYQWLHALGDRYRDFYVTSEAALEFAARSLKIELSAAARQSLMQGFLEMRAWPDVPAALLALRASGMKLALLSNATPRILGASLHNSSLDTALDEVISTDRIRSFKPDPRAYQLGVGQLQLPREQIAFVAFAGWDVAGAKWFGYPTFWNNRLSAAPEALDVRADAEGTTFDDLLRWLDVPVTAPPKQS